MIPCLLFSENESGIEWQKFDAAALAQARVEKKLVFLDVEAVWCHWCHVMEKKTFSEPQVQEALRKNFISTKLDQDSRPDLSRRYEAYGWPALVILDPVTMRERVIGSGFQTKEEFLALLKSGQNPNADIGMTKTSNPPSTGALTADQKRSLLARLRDHYDPKATGWGSGSKFVPWGNIEYCIRLSENGDSAARKMAEDTLSSATRLIDPVWGGLYQYSTDDDWEHPHFEKIMEFEAEVSRAYALAYLARQRPEDLQAAEAIVRHLHDFLRSPEGAYYVSQDADIIPGEHSAEYFSKNDAERRAIGIPRVDRHVYSRENGLAISALVTLYQATGKTAYLDDATTAARWIIANRALEGGGFSHDPSTASTPFLADQVYMGRALLLLHQVTADNEWLARASACADFCMKTFMRESKDGGGFLSGPSLPDNPPPVVDRDENIEVARWLNLMGKTTRESRFNKGAEHAMRYLADSGVVAEIYSFTGGLLLADEEIAGEPVHIAIVGNSKDPAAAALFASAQKYPDSYKVIEWLTTSATDQSEIRFPDNDRSAAYLCSENRCSPPKFSAEELERSFRKTP
ncbi:MAG: DUF255 domain-containing protein [Luteolibacter sp.]